MGALNDDEALRAWAFDLLWSEDLGYTVEAVIEQAKLLVAFVKAEEPEPEDPGAPAGTNPFSAEYLVEHAQGTSVEDCPACAEERRRDAPYRVYRAAASNPGLDGLTAFLRVFPEGREEFTVSTGFWIGVTTPFTTWRRGEEIDITDLPEKLRRV